MLFRFLQSNPIIRLLFPLLVGILLGNNLAISANILLIAVGIWGCGILFTFLFKVQRNTFFTLLNLLFFLFLGMFLVQNQKESYAIPKDLTTNYTKAIIRQQPEQKTKSTAVLLEIMAVETQGKLHPSHFKALAYFNKDTTLQSWQYGDTLITKLAFQPLPKLANPYAFDYAKLLQQRQIYTMARGKTTTTQHAIATDFSILLTAKSVQKKLIDILKIYIPDTKIRGFLQAMTLGDKTSLSPEIRVDFANTGVVHILAVSGLHVGILFGLLNFLFRPLRKSLRGRILLSTLGLLVIWGFTFISGLSVSILRASIMFSILQLSLLPLRPYRIYNSIALSAILLLLYNPFFVYELGFQLSYFAVLGIVTFVPMWNFELKNLLLNKLKTLVLVSLSAQIGIAPLLLYYFHQFPSYFLLTNIVVLLLAPLLLGGTLLLLACSALPIIAKPLAFLLTFLTQFCIDFVNFMAELPYSILLHYQLDFPQILIAYSLVLAIIGYIFKRKKSWFYLLLSIILLGATYTGWRNFEENHQNIFVVHQVRKKSYYTFLHGKKAILLTAPKVTADEISYTILPLFEAKNTHKIEQFYLTNTQPFAFENIRYKKGHCKFQNKHIVFCNNEMQCLEKPVKIDILVLSKNSDWQTALKNYAISEKIILDSSFSKQQSQKLKKELSALHYTVHNVNTDGAFVL